MARATKLAARGRGVLIGAICVTVASACLAPQSPPAATASPSLASAATSGLRVCQVAPAGPAQRAGIRPEDRILAIDGQALDSFDRLAGAIQAHQPGETVTLALTRGPSEISAPVQLGERDGRAYLGLTGCAS